VSCDSLFYPSQPSLTLLGVARGAEARLSAGSAPAMSFVAADIDHCGAQRYV